MNFAVLLIIDFVAALTGAGIGYFVGMFTERGQTREARRRIVAFAFAMISMFVVCPRATDLWRHFQSH
jgi:hypothetical protein